MVGRGAGGGVVGGVALPITGGEAWCRRLLAVWVKARNGACVLNVIIGGRAATGMSRMPTRAHGVS